MLYLGIDQHAKQLTISLRNDAGDIVLKRQVSTEPKRCAEFFTKLQDNAGDKGYIAILEACGFNDWLPELLPTVGCTQTILIQPTKKHKGQNGQTQCPRALRVAVSQPASPASQGARSRRPCDCLAEDCRATALRTG